MRTFGPNLVKISDGKNNFVLDELVFSLSDSSSESFSEDRVKLHGIAESVIRKHLGHLKVSYNNWIECNICKQ